MTRQTDLQICYKSEEKLQEKKNTNNNRLWSLGCVLLIYSIIRINVILFYYAFLIRQMINYRMDGAFVALEINSQGRKVLILFTLISLFPKVINLGLP